MGIVFKKVNNGWTFAKNKRKEHVNEALAAAEEMALLNKTITFGVNLKNITMFQIASL